MASDAGQTRAECPSDRTSFGHGWIRSNALEFDADGRGWTHPSNRSAVVGRAAIAAVITGTPMTMGLTAAIRTI
ncbi:hypothetical protein CP556_05440 [Natrinema sp. CBA1119]|nr:hypothetical protein CP556_05440 [Natrinema sp. CBA1119]